MKDLRLRLSLTKRDGSFGLRVTDSASDSPIADIALTSEQVTDLLAERSITTCGSILVNPATAQLGRSREHVTYTPSSEDLSIHPHTYAPTYEMLYFGELYRDYYGWDTATWSQSQDGVWHLHLVRWVDTDPYTR